QEEAAVLVLFHDRKPGHAGERQLLPRLAAHEAQGLLLLERLLHEKAVALLELPLQRSLGAGGRDPASQADEQGCQAGTQHGVPSRERWLGSSARLDL